MTSQHFGTITTWKDDKGFGFITPDDGEKDVFFHINDVVKRQQRPAEQVKVRYILSQDENQRIRATNIRLLRKDGIRQVGQVGIKKRAVKKKISAARLSTWILTLLFCIFLLLITWLLPSTGWLLALYGISSIITYRLYVSDKQRAKRGAWRISERQLHLLELVGGWPGALLAQEYVRHKTVKGSYQLTFWLIVGCNLILLIGYAIFVFQNP